MSAWCAGHKDGVIVPFAVEVRMVTEHAIGIKTAMLWSRTNRNYCRMMRADTSDWLLGPALRKDASAVGSVTDRTLPNWEIASVPEHRTQRQSIKSR